MPESTPKKVVRRRGRSDRYEIDQCALYKTGSLRRLAKILLIEKSDLIALANSRDLYSVYDLEDDDEFSDKRGKIRKIQDPVEELKKVQRRVAKLLQYVRVPCYLHSAVKGVSYRSNVKAHAHTGTNILTMDVASFYSSTRESQVFRFFWETLLCAPDVARTLTRLLTWHGVLPTGGPASPLLSFHCNREMFEAIAREAECAGVVFTCYVDDITFSGTNVKRGFASLIERIVRRSGYRIAVQKTRFYRANQAALVTGAVIQDGKVSVPHARRRKARRIEVAAMATKDPARRLALTEKLMGLAGEAASIDPAFRGWAYAVRARLVALRNSAA